MIDRIPDSNFDRERVSPYPLRIREPKRRREPMQSMQSTDDVPESYKPENLKDALNSQDAALCKLTGEKEYNSIISNKTWTLATLTSDRTAIKSRLIFKVKPGIHGAAPRYKARSVAKNYSQRPRIDFDETFAPVAKQTTLRTVLVLHLLKLQLLLVWLSSPHCK